MQDLIDRQAAIDAVEAVGFDTRYYWAIKNLPSAQPERLIDDDFETIRIHLNAFKEELCNQWRWEEAEEYQRILDRFMTFASAQQKPLKYSGESICVFCRTTNCDGCLYEPMEGVK